MATSHELERPKMWSPTTDQWLEVHFAILSASTFFPFFSILFIRASNTLWQSRMSKVNCIAAKRNDLVFKITIRSILSMKQPQNLSTHRSFYVSRRSTDSGTLCHRFMPLLSHFSRARRSVLLELPCSIKQAESSP